MQKRIIKQTKKKDLQLIHLKIKRYFLSVIQKLMTKKLKWKNGEFLYLFYKFNRI